MSKVKVVFLGLLAAFALSAAASSTASASTSHVYLIEGTELAKGSEAVEGDSLRGKVEVAVAGSILITECSEDLVSGGIKPEGKSEFTIEFKNCYVANIEKGKLKYLSECSVTEPVKAKGTDELIEHSVDEFGSLTSELIITGTKCVPAATYPVGGKQLCSTPETTAVKVVHTLECTPSGSALTLKSVPAQLFGEEQLKLSSKKGWSAT